MTVCRPRVLLVGAYPPPPGGNSVHIERLSSLLASRYDVAVVDPYSSAPRDSDPPNVYRCKPRHPLDLARALRRLSDPEAAIVHVHVSAMNAFAVSGHALLRAVSRSARKVLTIHSGSFVRSYAAASTLRRNLIRSLLASFDRVVVVNDEQRDLLRHLGIPGQRVAVIPAFLPPSPGTPPAEITALRASCDRLVLASGYGLPHYGFTAVLDALDALDRSDPDGRTGAAFFLYNRYDEDYVETIAQRLTPLRIVLRDCTAAQFAGALRLADVYVRATDRDGDAVAIREAAACGTKIVASDAVPRPAGCERFRTGDPASLAGALERVRGDVYAGRVAIDVRAGADALFRLYRDLIGATTRATA